MEIFLVPYGTYNSTHLFNIKYLYKYNEKSITVALSKISLTKHNVMQRATKRQDEELCRTILSRLFLRNDCGHASASETKGQ